MTKGRAALPWRDDTITAISDNPQQRSGKVISALALYYRSGLALQDKARFRTTIGVLILQAWLVCQALALDPHQPASTYLRTDFTVENGLPDNKVNAILQTRNGFLWVGTDGGLADLWRALHPDSFPRRKFQRDSCNCLIDGGGRRIWVGTDSGLAPYLARGWITSTARW